MAKMRGPSTDGSSGGGGIEATELRNEMLK